VELGAQRARYNREKKSLLSKKGEGVKESTLGSSNKSNGNYGGGGVIQLALSREAPLYQKGLLGEEGKQFRERLKNMAFKKHTWGKKQRNGTAFRKRKDSPLTRERPCRNKGKDTTTKKSNPKGTKGGGTPPPKNPPPHRNTKNQDKEKSS